MLVQTPHINNQLLSIKQKVILSKERPLLLIVSQNFRFFSTFVKTILELYKYPVKIQTVDSRQVMDYTLPLLCFDGYLLAKENLVEFICDIAFSRLPFDQYVLRKENIKSLYQSWQPVFGEDSFIPSKGDFQLITKDSIPNKLYSNFISLSRFVASKGYQRIFSSYDDRNINAEALFAIDVVDTILFDCSREDIDYILRGDFEVLINFCRIYKERLSKGQQMQAIKEQQEMNIDKDGEKYVLIDKKKLENIVYPTKSYNFKWFAGMAVTLAFIFGKWAK